MTRLEHLLEFSSGGGAFAGNSNSDAGAITFGRYVYRSCGDSDESKDTEDAGEKMTRLLGIEPGEAFSGGEFQMDVEGPAAGSLGKSLRHQFVQCHARRASRTGLGEVNRVVDDPIHLVHERLNFLHLVASADIAGREQNIEVVNQRLKRAKRLPELMREITNSLREFNFFCCSVVRF